MTAGIDVALGLGSNVGDTLGHVGRAVALLEERGILADLAVSSLYRTAPWGPVEQDWFLNACVAGRTILEPTALLAAVKALESEIGRTATVRWGPRVIDIDILFYGDRIVRKPGLAIPHPEMARRPFVLVPLAEIRPDHRLDGVPIAVMAAGVAGGDIEKLGSLPQT